MAREVRLRSRQPTQTAPAGLHQPDGLSARGLQRTAESAAPPLDYRLEVFRKGFESIQRVKIW